MKMLKLKTLLVVGLLSAGLVGCGGYVPMESIKKAEELCKGNEGVAGITILIRMELTCKNGAEFGQSEWYRTADYR